ncbi:SCF ubiquitin ligase, Skp1 component [Trachipleistophora hominis]|uniref:SCF ubiquitin ligase, Skp1 component n=1 Tax=Trachipleistophora hominis TaxID=72359 RepID=L7JZP0_TRAHO|nr:SCF ubiquitin ligase, Skp1 component [Trachipleistophora hominis]
MQLDVMTTDKRVYTIPDKMVNDCILFRDIANLTDQCSPISILVHSSVLEFIMGFSEINTLNLPENYDAAQIVFAPAVFEFINALDFQTLSDICTAANYVHYPALLELCCKVISKKLCEVEVVTGETANELTWISSDEDS